MNSHGTDENDWRCLFLGKYNYRNETEKTHTIWIYADKIKCI